MGHSLHLEGVNVGIRNWSRTEKRGSGPRNEVSELRNEVSGLRNGNCRSGAGWLLLYYVAEVVRI